MSSQSSVKGFRRGKQNAAQRLLVQMVTTLTAEVGELRQGQPAETDRARVGFLSTQAIRSYPIPSAKIKGEKPMI